MKQKALLELRKIDDKSLVLRVKLVKLYNMVYAIQNGTSLFEKFVTDKITPGSPEGIRYMDSIMEMEYIETQLAKLVVQREKIYAREKV